MTNEGKVSAGLSACQVASPTHVTSYKYTYIYMCMCHIHMYIYCTMWLQEVSKQIWRGLTLHYYLHPILIVYFNYMNKIWLNQLSTQGVTACVMDATVYSKCNCTARVMDVTVQSRCTCLLKVGGGGIAKILSHSYCTHCKYSIDYKMRLMTQYNIILFYKCSSAEQRISIYTFGELVKKEERKMIVTQHNGKL